MGKIIISTNVSLDGVVQDPDGTEGSGRGDWFGRFMGTDREEWAKLELDEALGAEALLLGRRGLEAEAGADRGHRRLRQLSARAHADRAQPRRRAAADRPPGRARGQ